MRANLQPKVALGQQLIRAVPIDTLQPMVVSADSVKSDFAKRLNAAIAAHPRAPTDMRSWRSWLAKRYEVSIESARKWLVGEAIPDTARLAVIALDLGVSVDQLLTGRSSAANAAARATLSPAELELLTAFRNSSAAGQDAARSVLALGLDSAVVAARNPSPVARTLHLAGQRRASTNEVDRDEHALDTVTLQHVIEQMELIDEGTPAQRAAVMAAAYSLAVEGGKKPAKAALLKLLRSA